MDCQGPRCPLEMCERQPTGCHRDEELKTGVRKVIEFIKAAVLAAILLVGGYGYYQANRDYKMPTTVTNPDGTKRPMTEHERRLANWAMSAGW